MIVPQSLVKKVTEDNETPAPGWALDQMARNTITNPGCSDELVDNLRERWAKLLDECALSAKLPAAKEWCEAHGIDCVSRLRQVDSAFVAALQLKQGRRLRRDRTASVVMR